MTALATVDVGAQALRQRALRYVNQMPDPQAFAREIGAHLLFTLTARTLDPDAIYFHRFKGGASSSSTFTGWWHVGPPIETLTFTQLLLSRFTVHEQQTPDELGVYSGFYSADASQRIFDERNEVRLSPQVVLEKFWALDIAPKFLRRIEVFWQAHGADFITLAKTHFIAQALRARESGLLVEQDYRFVLQAMLGALSSPLDVAQLNKTSDLRTGTCVRTFDIAGYRAADMYRVVMPDRRQILYCPSLRPCFHIVADDRGVSRWVRDQCRDPSARARFLSLFMAGNAESAAARSTLAGVLERSVTGTLVVNQLDLPILEEPFAFARKLAQQQMVAQAEALMTSNASLRRQLWSQSLGCFLTLFGGFAVMTAPMALAVVGAGVAKLVVDVSEAVAGATVSARRAGVLSALLDSLFIAFNAPLLRGLGSPGAALEQGLEGIEAGTPAYAVEDAPQPNIVLWIDEQPAIRMDGVAYPVRYVADSGQWFIVDPANPFAFQTGVPVRFDPLTQTWTPGPALRLLGGMDVAPPAPGGSAVQPIDWSVYMRADPAESRRLARIAMARQRECLQHLPVARFEGLNDTGDYVDDFGGEHRVYQMDDGQFISRAISGYTSSGVLINAVFRLTELETTIAETVAEVLEFADDLDQVGHNAAVDLYRGGSGARGTSGAHFRNGTIKVGDILVNTDVTSFTENPYIPVRFASTSLDGAAPLADDVPIFDDTSVLFVLRKGTYFGAFPIAPFSDISDEAESLILPGAYWRVEGFGEESGEAFYFMRVDLTEVAAIRPGDRVFDMRTGEPFSPASYAAKMHPGAELLVRRFFAH
jgi:hypothetical protein